MQTAAFDGRVGQAAYAASRGAVAALTLPLARNLARNAIRVVTIAPGIFETPMLADVPAVSYDHHLGPDPAPIASGRTDEFAQLVESITQTPMLSGEVIPLDGAVRMPIR